MSKDLDGDGIDRFDESMLPIDHTTLDQIVDNLIYLTMVEFLSQGCKLTDIERIIKEIMIQMLFNYQNTLFYLIYNHKFYFFFIIFSFLLF